MVRTGHTLSIKRFQLLLLHLSGSFGGQIFVAHRELLPGVIHVTDRYANNRAEQSHEATRVRERGMRKFKSMRQAQRFVTAHAAVSNLFNLGA